MHILNRLLSDITLLYVVKSQIHLGTLCDGQTSIISNRRPFELATFHGIMCILILTHEPFDQFSAAVLRFNVDYI